MINHSLIYYDMLVQEVVWCVRESKWCRSQPSPTPINPTRSQIIAHSRLIQENLYFLLSHTSSSLMIFMIILLQIDAMTQIKISKFEIGWCEVIVIIRESEEDFNRKDMWLLFFLRLEREMKEGKGVSILSLLWNQRKFSQFIFVNIIWDKSTTLEVSKV